MKFLVIGLKSDERTMVKNALKSIPDLDFDLQLSGHSVEGLFKIRSFQPDFVLIDESGLDCTMLMQLRQARAEALIYVVVAEQSDSRACELIRKGATDTILRDHLSGQPFLSLILRACERLRISGQFRVHELAKANARLCGVANTLSTMSWLSDESGERILFNDKWLKFTGRTLEQELGKKWTEAVHPQDLKRLLSVYTNALRERKSYHVEYRLRTADGQFRLIWESGSPQLRADGAFIGMLGSCADISQTIFTKDHLSPVFEPVGVMTTLDHVPIGVWKLDPNLVITKTNPAVATLFSVTPEHLVGRTFTNVVSSIPDNTFSRVLQHGERIKLENHPVTLTLDEKRRKVFLDFAAWPLRDKANKVVGVCVSTTEVTERLLADQQREDFVAALVHDLKTPLIGADQALEAMLRGNLGPVDANQSELLSMLKRSNQHLLTMVHNLIEAYRYDAGEARMSVEEFNLFELIDSCIEELAQWSTHKEITMRSVFSSGNGIIIGDRMSIRRVILNLLDNALKFTPKDGVIEVSAEEEGGDVIFRVSDTGVGIPQSEFTQVFLRYWQGDSAKQFAPGTGLGLYLCRQIIVAHGGTISVCSKLGEGTTFSVTIPKQPLPH
ncbi:MAG: ATP-binding protein [Candidatus Obscuribacterales bacterium]|nr:PAS domain S-box protein [Cyanobacteria bacterium SZAS LIN-5]